MDFSICYAQRRLEIYTAVFLANAVKPEKTAQLIGSYDVMSAPLMEAISVPDFCSKFTVWKY